MRWSVPVIVLIVLLSGCTGSEAPTSGTQTTAIDSTSTEIERTASQTTTSPEPTPIATPLPTTARQVDTPEPVDNPWGKEPIVIGISGSPDRNYTPQITRAVEYWEENDDSAIDWRPAFEVRSDAVSPDIEIRFVDAIHSCGVGISDNTIGCARLLSADSHPQDPEIVRINDGLTNESAYRTIRHELGHVLGLEHGEGPSDVMAPYDEVYNQIIRVHVEFETTAEAKQRDTRRQVWYALEYYSEGADGHVEEAIEFAVIDDPSVADIVIEVNREGSESRASVEGERVVIEVNGIPSDRRGWHVGYWLGYYFGASSVNQLPPPFDEPEADPRVGWWE